MTFGKNQDPVSNGRKGALVANKNSDKQRRASYTRWGNEEYRRKLHKSMEKTSVWSKEHLTRMGKLSRVRENNVINSIKHNYDHIFLPQEVCDRIVVKDGEILFIEVKNQKEQLKPKQEHFRKIAKQKYIVIRSP